MARFIKSLCLLALFWSSLVQAIDRGRIVEDAADHKSFVGKSDIRRQNTSGHLCVTDIALIAEAVHRKKAVVKNIALANYLEKKYPGELSSGSFVEALAESLKFLRLNDSAIGRVDNKLLEGLNPTSEERVRFVNKFSRADLDILKAGGLLLLSAGLIDKNARTIGLHSMIATKFTGNTLFVLDPNIPSEILLYRVRRGVVITGGERRETLNLYPVDFNLGNEFGQGEKWSIFSIMSVSLDPKN
jgi:hypothetical protein